MSISSPRRLRSCLYLLGFVFITTLARATTVTTLPATGLSFEAATFNATATLSGGSTYFGYFEWGPTTNYGSSTGQQLLGSGGNASFNQPMTGLFANQVYHFRADVIILNVGTVTGNDQVFTIPFGPISSTAAATSIHPGQATLNGFVNPSNTNNVPATYWFEHGATTSYGSVTPAGTIPAATTSTAISNLVTGLPRAGTYHFRSAVSNVFGTNFGTDMSFTTLPGKANASGSTGGGMAFDIRQPCLELNFLVCTNGAVPPGGGDINQLPILGEICLFAGKFAPAGWAFCQGQLVNTNSNILLYDFLGTHYGGGGTSNFALPDFRGYRAVHCGPLAQSLAKTSGATQEVLNTNQLTLHTHSLPFPYNVTGAAGNSAASVTNVQLSLAVNYLVNAKGFTPTSGSATVFEPFVGEVVLYAGSNDLPNTGLDGQNLAVSAYGPLYAAVGTNYGGNGTFFNLPNLVHSLPLQVVGAGQGPITSWSIGQYGGSNYPAITVAQMPAHQHSAPALGIVTGLTGSNQPIGLIQESIALQYLISTNGQIPSATVLATNTMMGQVQPYLGTNLPGGWLPCDGRLLQIANAPSLFGVLSNSYGGDGITTFALPNLCGRVPIGTTNGQPGAAYGAEQVVLTVANLPPHTHTLPSPDFDYWITSFGLSNNAAGFTADADGDAARNGYEWATGSNPTDTQSRAPLTIDSTGGKANIHFARNTNATDVIFTLQRSTNLANASAWTGIATNQAGVWKSAATITEIGAANPVNVTISDTFTNVSAMNYRLQITWP